MSLDKSWIPDLDRLEEIARKAGFERVEDMFSDIPREALYRDRWDLLKIGERHPLSEMEVVARLEEKLSRVRPRRDPPPFLGGGAWAHYVPAYQRFILMLGEILTSYTPYQPEASQGLLQALFEYQSLIAEIYDMDVVNSSHYDGSTALAEALLMALRARRGRRRIVVPQTLNPRYLDTIHSYLEPHGVEIVLAPANTRGELDLEAVEELVNDDTAAVVGELPNGLGKVDPGLEGLGEIAHRRGALYIVLADPIASTIYKPPGELGADVAVGEGQPLGLGLNYGGPYLGIMAVRWDLRLIRQMPGRITGLTVDREGRRAFTLILQTREQHIRRARATSNITTNEALMAVLAAAYIAGHGYEGLRRIALGIRARTILARSLLSRIPGVALLEGESWRELAVRAPCPFTALQRELRERKGILVGPPLYDNMVPWTNERWGLIAVTEAHTVDHIRYLADSVREIAGEVCEE